MRGIATFVALLVGGLAVVGYLVTRPEDRDLSAVERAWVVDFRAWRDATERRVEAAVVGIAFTSEGENRRLLAPLRRCSATLEQLGAAPPLFESAHEAALDACGQAEHAVALDRRYGLASLATTKLHLGEAGDRLALARRAFQRALGEAETPRP